MRLYFLLLLTLCVRSAIALLRSSRSTPSSTLFQSALSDRQILSPPPGDYGLPLLGDKPLPFTKSGSQYLESQHQKWGPIFKQRLLFTKAVVVTGLENLKVLWQGEHDIVEAEVPTVFAPLLGEKGIFMTKGDAHHKLKQQLARGFSPKAVGGYLPQMQSLTEAFFADLAKPWRETVFGVNVAKELSFAIILEVVMGFERDQWLDKAAYGRLSELYKDVQAAMFAPPINLPGTPFRKALNARQQLLVEIEKSINTVAAKMTSSEEGVAPNVVSILLNSVDEMGEKITMEQIKDVSFNMLDAGQESKASS